MGSVTGNFIPITLRNILPLASNPFCCDPACEYYSAQGDITDGAIHIRVNLLTAQESANIIYWTIL